MSSFYLSNYPSFFLFTFSSFFLALFYSFVTLLQSIKEEYFPSRDVCKSLRISPSLLGKIVGMVLVEPGRHDFGLNFKKNGQYCLLGYVRKVADTYDNKRNYNNNQNNNNNGSSSGSSSSNGSHDVEEKRTKIDNPWGAGDSVQVVGSVNTERLAQAESAQWEYSAKALALLLEYKSKFPLMFERFDNLPHQMKYQASDIFCPPGMKGEGAQRSAFAETAAKEVEDWMKSQPFFSMARTPLATISLSKLVKDNYLMFLFFFIYFLSFFGLSFYSFGVSLAHCPSLYDLFV